MNEIFKFNINKIFIEIIQIKGLNIRRYYLFYCGSETITCGYKHFTVSWLLLIIVKIDYSNFYLIYSRKTFTLGASKTNISTFIRINIQKENNTNYFLI